MGSRARRALVVALAAVLLLGAGGLAVRHLRATGCAADVQPVAAPPPVLLDARARAGQQDPRRDRLVRAAAAWGPPFGPVLGAVGYDYDQFVHVAGLPGGLALWTRDDPTMRFLAAARGGHSLRPRWGVRTLTARSAWDAAAHRFLDIALPRDRGPALSALALSDGHRLWCARLGERPVGAADPLATQVLPGGDVAALTPGSPGEQVLTRLAGADGSVRWRSDVRAGGDFLGGAGAGVLVAGGVPAWRLADPGWLARRPAGAALVGVSARTGHLRWSWHQPAGTAVHVLGVDPLLGRVVVMTWGPHGGRLLALDRDGSPVWSADPFPGYHLDATLRGGRVLVRADDRLAAWDAATGRRLWQESTPSQPQFFPYGFELDSVPSLDARRVLLPTTTALRVLDLDTGVMSAYPLPRDGVSTTFWPYQVAVSDRLVAVVTNTGTVVLRLDRFPR
ncbi:MAG TPA: PQQ-binding-like beta-propeller repeat protein [Marmoricola sp.]|nr:PQQ-binding-like beta-propeller repeat protein [Marmoricola sp.]